MEKIEMEAKTRIISYIVKGGRGRRKHTFRPTIVPTTGAGALYRE
jgi:hypothetical protein